MGKFHISAVSNKPESQRLFGLVWSIIIWLQFSFWLQFIIFFHHLFLRCSRHFKPQESKLECIMAKWLIKTVKSHTGFYVLLHAPEVKIVVVSSATLFSALYLKETQIFWRSCVHDPLSKPPILCLSFSLDYSQCDISYLNLSIWINVSDYL